MMKMTVSAQSFVHTVERNFNGVSLNDLGWCIPQVIQDALLSSNNASILSNRMHFKLIIDCTNDDSILHLLNSGEVVNNSKRSMFKLSHLPQDVILEELRLIVGMKFAALQGNLAMLSQMESINESFYDLFNNAFKLYQAAMAQFPCTSILLLGAFLGEGIRYTEDASTISQSI